MKVLIDTAVWSLALRRRKVPNDLFVMELQELVKELRVQMIGPIRQEILSGIREQTQFENLRDHLRAFPDLELTTLDYERAAEFFNINRSKGIQGSNTDFLMMRFMFASQMLAKSPRLWNGFHVCETHRQSNATIGA